MPQIKLANGVCFDAEPNVSVLEAAQSHSIRLDHSCQTGRCGSCKARVVSGKTVSLREGTALSPQEREEGWILTCTDSACGDLELAIEDLGAVEFIEPRTLPARIATLERLAPDVMRVVLRLPPTANFQFLPGQYIDVIGPAGVRRSYSIASDSAHADRLELQIRRVDQGVLSTYWFEQAKVNDLVRFHGPKGTFFLRPVAGMDVIFLSTGTGYAPIQSMLAQLERLPSSEQPSSVSLYWGARSLVDFYVQLPQIEGLRYVPVLSRPAEGWNGFQGYVQDIVAAQKTNLERAVVYACGSPAMIQAAEVTLRKAGLPERRFHFDAFVSSN